MNIAVLPGDGIGPEVVAQARASPTSFVGLSALMQALEELKK